MIVRSFKMKEDPFHPKENKEELLGLSVLYFNAISALMYFANYTRLDIAFSISLLVRYSYALTRRH